MLRQAKGTDGTSLQGYITATYAELEYVLGEPNSYGDGYKVNTEWVLYDTNTGEVVTIYDWKYHPDLNEQYEWHIGGTDAASWWAVREAFPNHYIERLGY